MDPSPEELAAILAAVERFVRDTTPAPPAPEPPGATESAWVRAARHEAVGAEDPRAAW